MKGADSSSAGRVVIVGPSADCCEVLKAVLSRRGLAIYSARLTREGLRLMRQYEPDVVVLDGETADADDRQVQAELDLQLGKGSVSLIVLGRLRGNRLAPEEVLDKPYHFAPLVHTIHKLAAARAA